MKKLTKIKPHLNACKHGYAHWLRQQVKNDKLTRQEAMQELDKRQDKQEILEILKRIKENVQDNSNNS